MYDTLKLILQEEELNNEICFIEEVSCRITDMKFYNNRVVGRIKNMLVDIRGTTLIVEGSLTKWLLGNNYEKCLSLWEIRVAIESLSVALGVPMEMAKIVRLDIAFTFSVKYEPWLYLRRLLYLDNYYRSNIEKETLYFDKYDLQLVFYDKIKELNNNYNVEELEDIVHLYLIRNEFRFKKVTRTLGEVRGKCLYDPGFCLSLLDKWYKCYMSIDKQVDEVGVKLNGVKGLKESCVALCMSEMNLFERVEESFCMKKIDSSVKFAILKELRRIGRLYLNNEEAPLIRELTDKVINAYMLLKRRYNIASARMEVFNKCIGSKYVV